LPPRHNFKSKLPFHYRMMPLTWIDSPCSPGMQDPVSNSRKIFFGIIEGDAYTNFG
jgi:hypothetical protein